MKKIVKIAAGCLLLAAGLLVALVILARLFITPERVKAMVLPLAEQALHRPITLSDVKVGLFSGIELHDLKVSEPGEGEPFVAADRVLLRFQWLPLLSRRVVIDEVALERPLIRVIRRADGSFNFGDLLAPKSDAGVPAVKTVEDKSGQPLSILVTVAKINGGRLAFVDRQIAATTEVTDLELDASGISADGTIPVKLSARLQGASLKMDGVVRPLQKNGKVGVDLQGLDVLAFEPYFRGKVPGKLSRLLVDLKGEFDLQGRTLTARGRLQGRELNLFLLALPTAPLQNVQVKAEYDVVFDLDRDQLAIGSLLADFNGLSARLTGEIARLRTAPQGDLTLTAPDLDLAALKGALPPALLGRLGELEPTGKLQISARMAGPLAWPFQGTASVTSSGLVLKGLAVTDFAGDLALRDRQLTISRMTGKTAAGTFSASARIDLHHPELVYDTSLSVQGVQIEPVLKALAPQAAGALYGAMTAQAALTGRGTQWETASRALSGDITMSLADGRLVSPALVKGFASFLQLSDLHEIVFRECRGKARIAGGQANIDGVIQSDRLKLFPTGAIGLDGGLNLAVDTRLSPELTARLDQRGKVTRYLLDADGWSQVPLLVGGTLQAPRYSLDPKGVGKVLQDELQSGLEKLLNKSKDKKPADTSASSADGSSSQTGPAPASPPPSNASQRRLEDSLKKIFGR